MLVIAAPGKHDLIARQNPAETIQPHRDRLTLDLAHHDAVGAEMLDAPYPRRMTVLRHDPDMLRANAGKPAVARDQVHRRRADEARRKRRRRPAVKLLRRSVLLDAAVTHQDDTVRH